MKTNNIALILAFALTASATARAQAVMSLDECLDMARRNNLELQSGQISIARAKDLQATTFDIDKTSLSLSQTPTTGGGPENALTLSQSFEFPTVYGARRSKLKAETRLEEVRYEVSRNTMEREVSAAYCSLMYAMEKKRLLDRQDTIYSHFVSIAEARHKSGESGELECMSARRLCDENRVAMAAASRLVANAQLQLALWLNTDTAIVPAQTQLEAIEPADPELTLFRPQSVPSVAVAQQEHAVAERNLSLSRQSFLPDISLGISTQALIKGFNPYNVDRSRFSQGDFMGFDVGISLPLFWGAKRARLKAAKKELQQSQLMVEQATRRASAQFGMARNEYMQARQRLDYYRDRGLADAAETYRIAQLSYENGEIVYMEYIQNLQAALSLQMDYAEAIDQYNQALIKLKYIHSDEK